MTPQDSEASDFRVASECFAPCDRDFSTETS